MSKKILIVDDEPAIVKVLPFSLKQDGYEIDGHMMEKKQLKSSTVTTMT